MGENALHDTSGRLGWPFPHSASASVFTAVFPAKGFFSWESLHKTLINTIFCVQLSRIEFPHAYALLPHPNFRKVCVNFLKTPFSENSILKPPGRCPISASHFPNNCQPLQAVKPTAAIAIAKVAMILRNFRGRKLWGQKIAVIPSLRQRIAIAIAEKSRHLVHSAFKYHSAQIMTFKSSKQSIPVTAPVQSS